MQSQRSPPQRYDNFKLWIQRNGCKIDPKLAIAADQSGSMGLEAKDELPANTAVMAIPEKLILTVHKCYNCSQLSKLYRANDELFDYEDSDDAEFNVLAVFIMYEKSKIVLGKREHPEQEFFSFWQPYIESVEQPQTAMDWSEEELSGMPQDFLEEVEHFRKEIERMQLRVVGYLLKRPQFEGLSREDLNMLFTFGYKFIMTRCFGYNTPGTSLIPLADLMNHNCEATDHQLINIKREQSDKITEEYTKHSDKVNIGQLLEVPSLAKLEPNFSPIAQYISEFTTLSKEEAERLNRCERRQKILQINSSRTGVDGLSLNYFSSSDEEDNDTQSEEQESREQEIEFLRHQEKEQMEVFQENYNRIRILDYKKVEEQLSEIEKREEELKEAEQKIFEAHRDSQVSTAQKPNEPSPSASTEVKSEPTAQEVQESKREVVSESKVTDKHNEETHQTNRQQNFVEGAYAHKALLEHLKEANKFQQFNDLKFMEEEKDAESSSSEQQSEDEFPWFSEPGTYFLISTCRPVRKGQQLYNCYGRRTNKFMLIWYGFCYRNNLFDSVSFRFHVDFSLERTVDKLIFDHYYGGKGLIKGFLKGNGTIQSNEVSRQFRLKRSRICEGLLIFLRLFLMNQYKGGDLGKLFTTIPSSFEFEIFVLSFIERLLMELSKRYPTNLIPKWAASKNYRENFKAIFFEEQLKIIDSNLQMVYQARGMLVQLMNNPSLTVEALLKDRKRDPELIRKLRKYLLSIQDNLKYIRLEVFSQYAPE